MCVMDCESFRTAEHDGYLTSVQAFMEIAIDLGFVPDIKTLKKIAPEHHVVSGEINRMYNEKIIDRTNGLKSLDKQLCPMISFRLDFWTDKGMKNHYLGIMAHELSEDKKGIVTWCVALQSWEDLVKEKLIANNINNNVNNVNNVLDGNISDDDSDLEIDDDEESGDNKDNDEDSDLEIDVDEDGDLDTAR
eukprot:317445_1